MEIAVFKFNTTSLFALVLSAFLFAGCDGCSGIYVIPGTEFAPDGGITVDTNKEPDKTTDTTPKPDAAKEKHRITLATPGRGGSVPQGSTEFLSAAYAVETATPENPLKGFTVACNKPGKGFDTSSPCPALSTIRVSCAPPGGKLKWFNGALGKDGDYIVNNMNCSSPNGRVDIQVVFDVKRDAQLGEEFRLGILDTGRNAHYETQGQERVPTFTVGCAIATRNDLVRALYNVRRYTMCDDPINRPVPVCDDVKDPQLSCMWSVVTAKKIIGPHADGKCRGDEPFNRAQMAKGIWSALNYDKPDYLKNWKSGYDDVQDPGAWFYEFVAMMNRFALHQRELSYRPGDTTTMCELQRSTHDYMSPIFWEVKTPATTTKISARRTEHFLATYNIYRATKTRLPGFKVMCTKDDFNSVDINCPISGIYFFCSVDGKDKGRLWMTSFKNGVLDMPTGYACADVDGRVQLEIRFDIDPNAKAGTKFKLGVNGGAYGQDQLPTFEVVDDGQSGTVTVEQVGCTPGIVRLKGPKGLSTDIQTKNYTARLLVGSYELDIIATAPNCGLDKVVDASGNPLVSPYKQVLGSGNQISFRVLWNTAP